MSRSRKPRRIFTEVLLTCDRLGLIGRQMLAIDGVKLPSNADKRRSGTHAELRHEAERMERAVATMLEAHRSGGGSARTRLYATLHGPELRATDVAEGAQRILTVGKRDMRSSSFVRLGLKYCVTICAIVWRAARSTVSDDISLMRLWSAYT